MRYVLLTITPVIAVIGWLSDGWSDFLRFFRMLLLIAAGFTSMAVGVSLLIEPGGS